MDASGKHSRAHQEILYALLCDSFEPLAHFINSFGGAPTPSAPPRLPPLSLANPIRPLPSSFNLGQDGGWEEGPRPKRWLPEFSYRGGSCAKAAHGLGVPSFAAFFTGVSLELSAGRFLSPPNDFMQRFHATVPNILRIPRISSHQARCILSPQGRTINSLQHRSNPNPV